MKTAFAAVLQQFFGPRFNRRNLMGSWTSTPNSLETLLHDAKDMLVVIDDYAPQETINSSKLAAAAEQVFRAQGNGAGRGRSRPDGSRRPTRRPRGLVLSTGEEVPLGYSLRARMLISFFDANCIDTTKLAIVQHEAEIGTFAKVMRAYRDYLQPYVHDLPEQLTREVSFNRVQFGHMNVHPRQLDAVANLAAGFNRFLTFARSVGGIDDHESNDLWADACLGLEQVARKQSRELRATDHVERLRGLLRTTLTTGLAYINDERGNEPPNSIALGWRFLPHANGDGSSRPVGDCIGWSSGTDLFLDPEAS